MESTCRLCSKQCSTLTSIFGFINDRLVSDLIVLLIPIKLDVNDDLPKKICEECLEIVQTFHELRHSAIKNDINFRSTNLGDPIQSFNESVFIKNEQSEDLVDDDYSVSNFDEEQFSSTCNQSSEQLPYIEHQKKTKKPMAEKRFPCPVCHQTFTRQTSVKRHMYRTHLKRKTSTKTKEPQHLDYSTLFRSNQLVECDACGETFKKQHLWEHIKDHPTNMNNEIKNSTKNARRLKFCHVRKKSSSGKEPKVEGGDESSEEEDLDPRKRRNVFTYDKSEDGTFKCPSEGCTSSFTRGYSLMKHCRHFHE